MRRYFFFLIVICLIVQPGLAANQVVRKIEVVDNRYQVTLSPSPSSEFTLPGYYVKENIGNCALLVTTDADYSSCANGMLEMIRVPAVTSSLEIFYSLLLNSTITRYSLSGTFLDKYKTKGSIEDYVAPATTSSSSSSSSSGDGWSGDSKGWTAGTPTPATPANPAAAIPEVIMASQIPTIPEAIKNDNTFWSVVIIEVIVVVILAYYINKKYYKKKTVSKQKFKLNLPAEVVAPEGTESESEGTEPHSFTINLDRINELLQQEREQGHEPQILSSADYSTSSREV